MSILEGVQMIIVDTREQLPLWDTNAPGILRLKLTEGDYTTTDLLNKAHIERKSGIDLYGSLIQGHDRFKREILRAQDKNIIITIFVECPKEIFIAKRFKGGYRLKTPPAVLRKIITTFSTRHEVNFIWCENRETMKAQMITWFIHHKRKFKDTHDKITANQKE